MTWHAASAIRAEARTDARESPEIHGQSRPRYLAQETARIDLTTTEAQQARMERERWLNNTKTRHPLLGWRV